MSSGFVSGGTIDKPVERDAEWLKAQAELDAKRLREKEEKNQQGGKSLYETLQANKVAKQEAFEESIKLKNQFRSLDEHEAEFLDSVLSKERAQEAAVRKETSERLEQFRKQQEQAQKAEPSEESKKGPVAEEEHWTAAPRKRKREKDAIPGVKLRKSSSEAQVQASSISVLSADSHRENIASRNPGNSRSRNNAQNLTTKTAPSVSKTSSTEVPSTQPQAAVKPSSSPGIALALGNYSSSDDD